MNDYAGYGVILAIVVAVFIFLGVMISQASTVTVTCSPASSAACRDMVVVVVR